MIKQLGPEVIKGAIRLWGLSCLIALSSSSLSAQDLKGLDTIKARELIDTLFIDHDFNNWSLRFFTNYKEQRFSLNNESSTLTYFPNNPAGVGIGVATRKLILDIAFNIKGKNEDPTKRFDIQADFVFNKHSGDYYLQSYKGFNVSNDQNDLEYFRTDLRSVSTGINYLYLFNGEKYSLASLKSGLYRQKRSAITFGLGGFMIANWVRADSTIIPPDLESHFNDEAHMTAFSGFGAGVIGGFAAIGVLPANFFVAVSINPGVGLSYKKVEAEDLTYKPSTPLLYELNGSVVFGFNGDRIYVNLTGSSSLFGTDLDFGNKSRFMHTNAKLSLGIKLGKYAG